ncbi:MAG TPA: diheme cytochrome c [Telluria sp.]
MVSHADERKASHTPLLPKYQQECAACHVAYPPQLLPAESWQRLMRGLPHHFGTDASLDAASVQQLSMWLAQHARTPKAGQAAPPEDRITRSAWFQREHREISPRTWQLPKVKSASNCLACHVRANQGVFDEHEIRIPN